MNFNLKHYKKSASIQLKPKDDISSDPERCVHFSIAWFKGKELTKEEQRAATAEIYTKLKNYLAKTDSKLKFTIVKACENCTYGHFDKEFEEIIANARTAYPLCAEKDLPLTLHPELPTDRTVMFHIAHSRSTDLKFNHFLKQKGAVLDINVVEAIEVNK